MKKLCVCVSVCSAGERGGSIARTMTLGLSAIADRLQAKRPRRLAPCGAPVVRPTPLHWPLASREVPWHQAMIILSREPMFTRDQGRPAGAGTGAALAHRGAAMPSPRPGTRRGNKGRGKGCARGPAHQSV